MTTIFAISRPLDLDVLRGLVGNNPATITELLLTFQTTGHDTAEALQRAVREAQPAEMVRQAHKLKSSSRTMGALRLGDICEMLEGAGLAGDQARIPALLEAFDKEYQSVCSEIGRELRERGITGSRP